MQDELMVKLIIEKGTKHWSSIASELNTNRTGKQVCVGVRASDASLSSLLL
jgi:hypothetical protein